MGALDAWKNRATQREEEFPSGVKIRYVIPSVGSMILAGAFPQSVIAIARQFESGKLELGKTQSDDDIQKWTEFRHRVVASMVLAVDGEEVSLSLEDVDALPRDDVDQLWMTAIRLREAPKVKV